MWLLQSPINIAPPYTSEPPTDKLPAKYKTTCCMNYCPACAKPMTEALFEGHVKKVCPDRQCGYVHWDNPIPVAAGLIRINNRYLIARNSHWPEGFFSLITGFIDTGETPAETIHRETNEELGITAVTSRQLGYWPFPRQNQLLIVHLVEAEGDIVLNHELSEYKLLSRDELFSHDFGPNQLMHWTREKLQALELG